MISRVGFMQWIWQNFYSLDEYMFHYVASSDSEKNKEKPGCISMLTALAVLVLLYVLHQLETLGEKARWGLYMNIA